ncbi:WD40-repeat-containing domain protein [Lipomyces doorenjongii]|uniref:WD40-repeat-containing domain protein n=1 Tax=Lipomyces doorenjongii TaxID=383834 RepID=UPI0034CE5614
MLAEDAQDGVSSELSDQTGQIMITLTTLDKAFAVPEVPLYVPLSLKRYGLSEVVNHLLATERPIPFDFLINSEILRTSLQEYIIQKGLSSEQTLALEYTRSILPPTFLASYSHPDWVSSVDVIVAPSSNANATPILSGCYDGIVRTWNLSGSVVSEFGGHTGPVKSVRWLDENKVVSASMDRSIRIWKVPVDNQGDEDMANVLDNNGPQTVVSARTFTGHKSTVEDLAVNAATSRMLSAGADGAVGLWTTNYKEAPPATVAVSTRELSGKRRRKTVVPSRGPISMMDSHTGPVTGVIFDPKDGTVGYSVSLDHTIKTWDLVTGVLVDTRTTSFPLLSITALPELSLLCSGSSARHVTLHDPRAAADATTSRTLVGHTSFVVSLSRSPESEYMLSSASHDGTVRVWDVRAQKSMYVISRDSKTADKAKVFGVHWSETVGIVSGGEDKRLQINRGTGLEVINQ